MQRRTFRSRFQKVDVALLVAGMGFIMTIILAIFSIADGMELATPVWIGSVLLSSAGLLFCWLWPPSKHHVAEAVRDSCGLWGLFLVFAVIDQDCREVVSFATLLILALALSMWVKRQQVTISGRTDHNASE